MAPVYNINLDQNATFKFSLQLLTSGNILFNIASWSFSGSIKQGVSDADPPIAQFTMSADTSSSTIHASLTPDQTKLLNQRHYVYDIIGTNYAIVPDEVLRLLQGKVKVNLGVTDPPPTD